ncbi:MAG: hypothetical protein A2268_11720 [Candidatus Raymondbacteria bacterium RifOxyA12_full_50_37]|uniref:Secretion system C-terminal sorting domain-containing protein n=1 Tax=Candidatus Raymondbacteria bacterium RIFOXYD12_FULL_49_13 TaxID=1817890 RepID=A0A1F7FK43_UNCRA|nr:MAG: hypothetical protein A2248_18935 [Candidatus Raymondbacteria bacterium RIFOXYA2_FULL_49_16]OGJ91824.1 MAG: hypothetical protein A2268_11720 [Candidatus Raymondbacteria bacterium RifOxyA12_full_50_37]OGJ92691.1 MAG: hypothetical protein A2350_04025 [Candidatus Raymondbacteria bacterium RifOxyB12_full_50_8]OGJ95418.1 MAG: hypothetical protein A2453_09155 [Candidatus Raymondbacteria bacterium RIFOXYC2_FULL_50_21]OGJ97848.1 MAG: hypothetical protein A2487_17655 [Candidatus Raymondbacteria b
MRLSIIFIVLCFFGRPYSLYVDMDPCPRIPLRPGESQYFLIHLSQASVSCNGTVSFSGLPAGLVCAPESQDYSLAPGNAKLLIFNLSSTRWGDTLEIRPTITASGGETINFPDSFKTKIMRDSVYYESSSWGNRSLKNNPLDAAGLMAYYSCGDGGCVAPCYSGHGFDRSVGFPGFWNEGVWIHEGGVKGKCVFGHNGLQYPRHRWSKIAFEAMNTVDNNKRGTILFWFRKNLQRVADMSYSANPDSTWKIGPDGMQGSKGEALFGHSWSPQQIYNSQIAGGSTYTKWKPGSHSFIGLRRFKAHGSVAGYLEAYYQAMRGDIYTVQAPYEWSEVWRHVAVVWDADSAKLEIYLDDQLASGSLRKNGVPTTDTVFYGCPWTVVKFNNCNFTIVQVGDEGGFSTTDRDEYYIYNKAMTQTEIQANRQASMGAVAAPVIAPAGIQFHDSTVAAIRSLWSNASIHFTTDGSNPSESDPVYSTPLVFTGSTMFKARSYLTGFSPSEIDSAYFECLGPDVDKPHVSSILSINNPQKILVVFDGPVEKTSAENVTNYEISGGVSVIQAALDSEQVAVTLTTDAPVAQNTMTIRNVADASNASLQMDDLSGAAITVKNLPGLMGYYNFDVLRGYYVKDLSSSGIDGTVFSDNLYREANRVPGHSGMGLYFDGNDFLDVTDYTTEGLLVNRNSPHNVDTFTIALWFKVPFGITGYHRYLFHKYYSYSVAVSGGKLCMGNWDCNQSVNVQVNDGLWHHLVYIVRDGAANGTKLFLDGGEIAVMTLSLLNNESAGLSYGMGGGAAGQPAFFEGDMDEIMMFNRALSNVEILALYHDSTDLSAVMEKADIVGSNEMVMNVSPNPFNPSTVITIIGQKEVCQNIEVGIYDLQGKLVYARSIASVANSRFMWNAEKQASGIYILTVKTGRQKMTKRIALLK